MFGVTSAVSLLWSDGQNSQRLEESKDVQRLNTAAGVTQNLSLPPADSGLGIDAQFQTSGTCGPGQISYQVSGGSHPSVGRFGQVNANVTLNGQDSIQLVSASAPAATLIVRVLITSFGQGALASRAANLDFQHNGTTYSSGPMQGPLPIALDLKTNVTGADIPLTFSVAETFAFVPNETGNLIRNLAIDSITIEDVQGNPIQITYTTASGNAYNIVGGSYSAPTLSAP